MNLTSEDIQEIVQFFEKHSQYWKRSVFLNLLEENRLLKEEMAELVETVNELNGKYQLPQSWKARMELAKEKE